ncbi:HemX protein [Mergibacter septicus]|uniref:HemX protein n=2 Tax=Mergibacter septicus TaxID=221402 RepID=A0A8D4IYN7_9PAST|nr:uroporphyrinogen-III C-methyltransferase [Mergibacter septicus]AWX16111.1 HemX protein [Mergibacter septicus]QDJ15364.1 HemX protein [Mergibacter septicus]WMR95602.1 uroporphyrinogen-III C-methyltransferase [Mergibacter septicus]
MKDLPENPNIPTSNLDQNHRVSRNTNEKTEQSSQIGQDNAMKQDSTVSSVNQQNKASIEQETFDLSGQQQRKEAKMEKKTSSGGKGLALLALFVALGMGGIGYFFANTHFNQVQQKLTALEQSNTDLVAKASRPTALVELQQKIVNLEAQNQELTQKLEFLAKQDHQQIENMAKQLVAIQSQLEKVSHLDNTSVANQWLFSEADFLLSNALRKLILDDDVEIAISLLKQADNILANVSDNKAVQIRLAIQRDLNYLANLNVVDQNTIMQQLSQLANDIDGLPLSEEYLNQNTDRTNDKELSNSIDDWKQNVQKIAESFLDRFIRIQPRTQNEKVLLPPDQEIYLRENIRLRLQIAILAVPRQQNELYKDSLETVASWVRSYFDTNATDTQDFLKKIDQLETQSIYIDAPDSLESLNLLDQMLHLPPHQLNKVQLKVDKTFSSDVVPTTTNSSDNGQ